MMAETAKDRHLLTDLRLRLLDSALRPVYTLDTVRRRQTNRARPLEDIRLVRGKDNLAQAIMIRLLTPRGELRSLAHPTFGSRLHEIVGRPNTETTRNLIHLYILESLQDETRVAEVTTLAVTEVKDQRQLVQVLLQVQPVGTTETVTIGPFILELNS